MISPRLNLHTHLAQCFLSATAWLTSLTCVLLLIFRVILTFFPSSLYRHSVVVMVPSGLVTSLGAGRATPGLRYGNAELSVGVVDSRDMSCRLTLLDAIVIGPVGACGLAATEKPNRKRGRGEEPTLAIGVPVVIRRHGSSSRTSVDSTIKLTLQLQALYQGNN